MEEEAANNGMIFGDIVFKAVIGIGYDVNGSDCVYDGKRG